MKAGRAESGGAKGTFCPGPGISQEASEDPRKKKKKKKKEGKKKETERVKFASGLLFLSAAVKAGEETENRVRKVEIDDKNIVCVK